MSLEGKVMDLLKQAMKDKNEVALRTLRAIKTAITVEKTSENGKAVLEAADEIKLIQKMAKQRRDSIAIFEVQNRIDLAKTEQEEYDYLQQFLPQQLSSEALEAAITALANELGITDIKMMGKLIGAANASLAGQAEGKAIAEMTKKVLNK